jgi:alkanesulfonate monooxygenase SsuD/methylene tetrahydromethanopterin reductase-like flavin-dependent oxidoreductase (luciferase family)
MKFGILASHQFPQDADLGESIKGMLGVVEYARDLDYDSVFTINHFVANLQTPQALSMTSKIIQISGRMQVGTGILILPLYHPVHIAEEFATLDHLSEGRVILGVGAGYRDEEYAAFGISKAERGGRLLESVEIIKALWTGEPVHYEGKYYQLNGQKIGIKPRTPGGPPLWIGAGARAAVERAARLGDAWLTPGNTPNPDYFSKHLAIYDDARRAANLPVEGIERPIIKELYVAEDPEEARRDVHEYLEREYRAYSQYGDLKWFETQKEALLKNSLVFGSPEQVTAKVRELTDLGFNHFVFRCAWMGMPWEKAKRSLRLFAEEVRPHFKAN